MTIEEYIAQLSDQVQDLRSTKAVFLAASSAHAEMVERIFTDGQASDGSSIGNYDTQKPLYVNSKNSPKNVPHAGKNGDTTFKNGNKHQTGYFKNYKSFREAVSRPTSSVNLDLFGRLKQEFENSLTKDTNTSYIAELKTDESIGKAEGNQGRFSKTIFAASQQERATFDKVLRFELRKIYA